MKSKLKARKAANSSPVPDPKVPTKAANDVEEDPFAELTDENILKALKEYNEECEAGPPLFGPGEGVIDQLDDDF